MNRAVTGVLQVYFTLSKVWPERDVDEADMFIVNVPMYKDCVF